MCPLWNTCKFYNQIEQKPNRILYNRYADCMCDFFGINGFSLSRNDSLTWGPTWVLDITIIHKHVCWMHTSVYFATCAYVCFVYILIWALFGRLQIRTNILRYCIQFSSIAHAHTDTHTPHALAIRIICANIKCKCTERWNRKHFFFFFVCIAKKKQTRTDRHTNTLNANDEENVR